MSKSGIGFRISNAEEEADRGARTTSAPASPLGKADKERILARLPALAEEPDDAKGFAMRGESIPAPRPGKTIREDFPPPAAPHPPANVPEQGPLTVERRAPEGPVDLALNLTVTFSQPMVAVTSVNEIAKGNVPVVLSPEPPGTWHWLGTRTLTFQPEKRFPMATEFTAFVPAGTKAANGEVLAQPVRWTFATPPPTMKSHGPSEDHQLLDPVIFASFDQAIDKATMLASIELASIASNAGSVPTRLATDDEVMASNVRELAERAESGRWLALKPISKLAAATHYTVRVKAGAKGAEGPRTTPQDQSFEFSTFGPLKFIFSGCNGSLTDPCRPLQPVSIGFSNQIEPAHFDTSMVTVTPAIPDMKVEVSGFGISIDGRTKGRTKYTVTIASGLTDMYGQTLGQDAVLHIDVKPAVTWKPFVKRWLFDAQRPMIVLDPHSPRKYMVYSVNEPLLHTRVYAVTPEDYVKYIQFSERWGEQSERPRAKPPGRLVVDKVIATKNVPDEPVATPIDLTPALSSGFGHAVVVVESAHKMPKGSIPAEFSVWVQSTKLGLSAFVENDAVTGWVTNLNDGAPIEDAQVSILDAETAETAGTSSKTRDGLARVPVSRVKDSLLVATKGKDVVFMPGDELDAFYKRHSNADPDADLDADSEVHATYGYQSDSEVRWFVFDDRGTYKPGEEVHVKGWVRHAILERGGDLTSIAGVAKNVSFRVSDSRGAEIANGGATIDDHGSFDFAFKLPANANLGRARLSLDLDAKNIRGTTGSRHSFEVQEFRRPEFEITTTSTEGPHFVGEHAIATMTASYYAGGGLASAPVNWSITRQTSSFTPPNRSDYHFGPDGRTIFVSKEETWSSVTNSRGIHRLRLDFDALEPAYPMSLDFVGRITDVNRQEWAGRTSMLVHPASAYVGVQVSKSFVGANDAVDLSLLAVDIDGKALSGRPIAVRAVRLESVRHGEDFEDKEVDAGVQTCNVTSGSAGENEPVHCTIKPPGSGLWRITAIVTDAEGRKNQTETTLWATGTGMLAGRGVDRDETTLIADKKEYKPGEVAELLVLAPFTPAEGVLTVRRQGIVHIERFTMSASSQVLSVKLDDSMVPNVEMRVDLVGASVRDDNSGKPDERLPKRPAYVSGAVDAGVLPVSRTLAVTVAAKTPVTAPGAATSIDVQVQDANGRAVQGAQVALVVADESVLALSGYRTPDPISAFYTNRSIDVADLGMRDSVIPDDPDLENRKTIEDIDVRYGEGVGGAGSMGLAGVGHGHVSFTPASMTSIPESVVASRVVRQPATIGAKSKMPIRVRTNFTPLGLFAPRVRTDAAGKATVPFKLPDNLTRYRVMAVASAGERNFGSNESTITARLPLMVRPSAPRFLNFGDRFELPIVVQNQTDRAADVGVVVRAANATIEEPSAKRVTVPPNERVEVRFATSTVKSGKARFQIGVASAGFSDASEVELPVYTPATTEAFATYGEIDNGTIAQPVKMPAGVFPQFGGLEISTSSTQLSALTDAFLYLTKYPFECNEQVASRVLAVAALRDVLTAFKAEGMPSSGAIAASMKADLDKLKRTQHSSGGWGLWQEEPWPYISLHVAHALVRAKDKGYAPDPSMMNRAQNYLREIESHSHIAGYSDDARRSLVAYSLYVRKLMGDADPARARVLIAEAGGVDKVPIEAMGWIWPTISDDKSSVAENEAVRVHVHNHATETADTAHFVSDYQDSNWVLLHSDRRADGILLESMIASEPSSSLIPKLVKGLLDHRKAGRWSNTQENAFVLLALDRYFNTYEKVTPDFVARVWLGDRFAGQHAFKGRTTDSSNIDVPMQWLAGEMKGMQNLVVDKNGPGRLYYRIGMQYAPTDLKLPPADHGFVVSRIYEGADSAKDVTRDADGTWHVRAGAKVRVRVSMVVAARRYHVALVDPLPAGLEALNPALAVTGAISMAEKGFDPLGPQNQKPRNWDWWYSNRTWYEHQNMRDERVEAFTSLLWDGVWDYTYVAKATTPGVYVVPPSKAEEMYAPETFGRSRGDRMIVE